MATGGAAGSRLSIIGCGVDPSRHLTREAELAILEQEVIYTIMPLAWTTRLKLPDVEIHSLFDVAYVQGTARRLAYQYAVDQVFTALEKSKEVGYLVSGGPVWFDSTVEMLVHGCHQREIGFRLVAGISAPEAVLSAVGASIAPDLLITDAYSVLLGDRRVDPATPMLVMQPHVAMTRNVAWANATPRETVTALGEALAKIYPTDHPVWVVTVAGEWPIDSIEVVAISALLDSEGSFDLRGSTLYVPALDSAPLLDAG